MALSRAVLAAVIALVAPGIPECVPLICSAITLALTAALAAASAEAIAALAEAAAALAETRAALAEDVAAITISLGLSGICPGCRLVVVDKLSNKISNGAVKILSMFVVEAVVLSVKIFLVPTTIEPSIGSPLLSNWFVSSINISCASVGPEPLSG